MSIDIESYVMGKGNSSDSELTAVMLTAEHNGLYKARDGKAYDPVRVNVRPVLQSKSAAPLLQSQTVEPDEGYDGLSSVSVSAVTSEIDANIIPENIKSGIEILGVEGSYENEDWLELEFDDDLTRLWIDLYCEDVLSPCLYVRLDGTVRIDWGDGSEVETYTANNGVTKATLIVHNYSDLGRYIISIEKTSGIFCGVYNGNSSIITDPVIQNHNSYKASLYSTVLNRADITYKEIFDGDNAGDLNYNASARVFEYNNNLRKVNINCRPTKIAYSCFIGSGIREIALPDSLTGIASSSFSECKNLLKIRIPNTVTQFGSSVFSKCHCAKVFDFTAFTLNGEGALPVTFGVNVFSDTRNDSIILFATQEIAEVAKQTTNLVSFASKIHHVGEEGI